MLTINQTRPDTWKYEPQGIGGKRILLTGGTTGIGRTTTLLLASQGAKVVIFGRHQEHLDDALKDMGDYRDRVHGLTADVVEEGDVDRVFDEADEFLGGLDVLINNAGVAGRSVTDTPPADYRYVIETDLLGYIACAHRAIPRLKQQGGGRIINVGSLSAKGREADSDIYVAAKSGLRGFSDSLAKKLQQENIHVTLIEPGSVGADLSSTPPEKERERQAEGTQLPSEAIAEAVAFCLSQPPSCFIPLLQIQPLHQSIGG